MNRLTEKTNCGNSWCEDDIETDNYIPKSQFNSTTGKCIEKLGKLEDLMEKYSIPDIEYLEKCIQDHDKYGEISEKLGVDLAEFVSELIYVLNHSNQTTGYTSKGKEITTDYGYVESFIEDLKNAIKGSE